MKIKQALYLGAAVAALALAATAPTELRAQQSAAVAIDGDDIGGVVSGPNGPEAGVWVIAETADLGTKFARMVVTDDQGRYVVPDLPKANYTLWVRGYGLVDSPKVTSAPGKLVNLTAVPAPTPAAAAEYYPGMYWYSMLKIPAASEFPGTGPKGNGIPPFMKTQGAWIDTVKNSCQSCHAVGSKGVRTLSSKLGTFKNSREAWERRIQSGQAMTNMAISIARLGPDKGIENYADWTDRIAAGELPTSKPERPKGIERNVVITMWDWGTKGMYLHDAIASDKYDQRVNANGPIYGSPEESSDLVPVIDPVKNTFSTIKHPYLDPATPSTKTNTAGPSVYWGDDPIWDSHTSIHNPMIDGDGRVWFTAKIRPDENPEFCKKGSDFASAKVAPLETSGRQLSMYDPKTQKWSLINTCFATQHLNFAHDANHTLWTSAGGPQSGVVGWLNTKQYLATGDDKASQGWTPIIVDTNGDGKRSAYVEANQPLDPTKDKRVMAAFYGVQPSPIDDTHLGPVDGRRLLAARSARLHHPPHPGREPDRDGACRAVPAARRGLRIARPRPHHRRRGVDGALERPHGELRSQEVHEGDQGPRGDHRQDVPGGLDALQVPRPAVQGRHRQGERGARLLHLGRPREHPRPRQERADRFDQWRRVPHRHRRRQVRDAAHPLPARLLLQERRRPHRRSECRLEGQGHLDDVRQPRPVPQRGRRAELAEALQGADAPRPARQLSAEHRRQAAAERSAAVLFCACGFDTVHGVAL